MTSFSVVDTDEVHDERFFLNDLNVLLTFLLDALVIVRAEWVPLQVVKEEPFFMMRII